MEYVAYIFAIFGLVAYLETSSLKKRIGALENELVRMKGTSYHKDRKTLLKYIRECIGKKVSIDLEEDHEDMDIITYGNTKYGSNTILDADDEWMLVRIESAKGTKEKLIRMESVQTVTVRE